MRTLSNELAAHLAGEVTTLATCWLLSRQDGLVLGFTDHSDNITIDDITYKAATGFTPTSIQSKSDFSVDNMEVEGILDSEEITEADIMAGLYDYAEIEIFLVNYEDLDQGRMVLKSGRTGQLYVKKNQFHAELRGPSQHLSQTITEIYSPTCPAILGDSRCKIMLGDFTENATVTDVSSNLTFTASSLGQDAGWFTGGQVNWTGGNNDGRKMEIKEFAAGQITLALPMPGTIQVGDTFDIIAGCDKTIDTCIAKFNNVVNFRGFPHIPGMDKLMETAGTFDGVDADN